jgi:hypothetical protein
MEIVGSRGATHLVHVPGSVLAVASVLLPLTASPPLAHATSTYGAFTNPQPVTIHGYTGDELEPYISPDGKYLLFNNGYGADVHTVLQYATSDGDGTFTYAGEIQGANDPVALNAAASLADDGTMYFTSTRNYPITLSATYTAKFAAGSVTGVQLVPGLAAPTLGTINFDVSVSANDKSLYVSQGSGSNPFPNSASILLYDKTKTGFNLDPKTTSILAAVNKANTLTYAADISANGKEFFYTQMALPAGQPAIYRAIRSSVGQPFSHVQQVAAATGFVEAPSLSADGKTLYFHRNDGTRFVIYMATRR